MEINYELVREKSGLFSQLVVVNEKEEETEKEWVKAWGKALRC